MRKIEVVKANEVEAKPFVLNDFMKHRAKKDIKRVNKKELKVLAKKLGLNYDDAQIEFAKKLIIAYLNANR